MPRLDGADVWKSKARSLQLQLRDRFRVAVHRHWRRRHHHHQALIPAAEGYFSSTIQRWLARFRDFRRDSLPSSTSFYRKRVTRDFSSEEDSALVRMMQAVAVPVLGNVCHVFMNGLNRVQVYGLEKLHSALLQRPKGKPLLTVSNHVASMDDPLVIASLLPPSVLMDARNLRWTLCATDRCFKNPVTSAFFRSVKVLPVSRGDGIYQEGMDMALSKLNHGGWVHIFPEGSRSRDGGKTMGSSKRGVGRLVLDGDSMPLVIPFVHTGMQEIMPIGANFPRIGKMVTVLIGDPINFDDILELEMEKGSDVPRRRLYDAVASRIGDRLHELKVQVDTVAIEQEMQLQDHSLRSIERTSEILQQVDWELFGMDSFMPAEDDSRRRQETVALPNISVSQPQQSHSDQSWRAGFSYRMRGYIDQMELVSFAARGIFMNNETKNSAGCSREIGPLKAWKQFVEANLLRQWNYVN
ncbi:N-acylphosphatidylethanolamine synthase [Cajanus cajan]|uniref:Tafazzin family protein n=1 Tax=Cajanus cajan TaxID=3821 RepID=A0A151TVU7_CAJCA|nr:N-acylphosphatidylethanolamine synthase [Cajanus cajan]KYP71202.1 Tafazzin [Cajanus cajan]